MNSSKQIKWGAILSYLSIVVNILSGLLYTPWMIDQIGKSQYGLYTLAHSLITLFLVDFGLSSATARYVSKYKAENNQTAVNNFLGVIYKLYLVIDLVIFSILTIVYFLLDKIYITLSPSELEVFKIVYIISAVFSVMNFPFITLNGVLTAYEKFIHLKLTDVLYRVLVVGFTVFALVNGMGIYALVASTAISGIIITIYKLIVVGKTTPVEVNFKFVDKKLYKDIFSFSIWVTVSTLAQRLIFNITPSVLGVVASSSAIAVFGIVTTIEGYAYTITNAINGLFMPKISKLYAENDDGNCILDLMLKIGRYQYIINGLIIVGFVLLGKEFIMLWIGKGYLESYYGIILVILPGLFFNSLQIANTAMIVQNKVKIQANISLATGIINLVLSPILAYKFGVIGACVSIFIAYMTRAILCNIIYYKVLNIDIKKFIKKCYLGMAPPLLLTLLVGYFVKYFMNSESWIGFIVCGILICIIYMVFIYSIGFSKSERKKVKINIKNLIH